MSQNCCNRDILAKFAIFSSPKATCFKLKTKCTTFVCNAWAAISEKRYFVILTQISNMRVEKISCPHCHILLASELIRDLTDIPTFNKYKLFIRNLEIQKSPNLKWCPNPKCSVVVSTNASKKTSKCPKCATEICNKCNREAHPRSSC